jgi:hypothetical protein
MICLMDEQPMLSVSTIPLLNSALCCIVLELERKADDRLAGKDKYICQRMHFITSLLSWLSPTSTF